jgi:hypothetical protein
MESEMNKTKLRKLKKMLKTDEQVRKGFYMPRYIYTIGCETLGCMAGWWAMKEMGIKNVLELDRISVKNSYIPISVIIGREFKLAEDQSCSLFNPLNTDLNKLSDPDLAALAVQSLIDGATNPWEAAHVRNSRA